jgi:DNA modification methylase
MNRLYFGDCLDILIKLHHDHPSGFVDLVYIDPPFNSKRNYNILFESADLKDAKAQKEAFADTWSNISYKDTLEQIKEIDLDLFSFLQSLDRIRISKSAVSYLTTMAVRIYYIQKILNDSGSFYLHCDPTMSHYLKIVCDLIFGNKNFRNEIIWHYRRWSALTDRFQRLHDVLLFYTKTRKSRFHVLYEDYTAGTMKRWKGIKRKTTILEDGSLYQEEDVEGVKGANMGDVWRMSIINANAIERLGYPTQKPEALLERIIQASSDEGALVLDAFCGCGTSISVAQRLKRKWIGIDISHLAIGLIERRLKKEYGKRIIKTYEVDGMPKDIASAKQLAESTSHGRLKFEEWIIETMLGGIHKPHQGENGSWDGHLTFDLPGSEKMKEVVLIEVKSGSTNIRDMRNFIESVRKQKAAIGVFVAFEDEVTKPAAMIAKDEGFYKEELFRKNYPKLQILTVEALLDGDSIRMPEIKHTTFKEAETKDTQAIPDPLF